MLRHLLDNARAYGAASLRIALDGASMRITEGGTGMGPTIMRSILETAGGTIARVPPDPGTAVRVDFAPWCLWTFRPR